MASTDPRLEPVQYVLDLPHRTAFERDDFLVTDANRAAVAAIERWPEWPAPTLILTGPEGSGKSHLAAVWRSMSAAKLATASDLTSDEIPALLANEALVIEDAPGSGLDERALFHALNLAKEQSAYVLITTRAFPSHWQVELPDLRSRLNAANLAELGSPDDMLLRALLLKQFTDRQIAIDQRSLDYMVSRMERSFAAARDLVSLIDSRALAERAKVTRTFIARVMSGSGFGDATQADDFTD